MEKDDARYSTLEQLHERRKQVVRLHRKGYGVMQYGHAFQIPREAHQRPLTVSGQ
ncbi:MAG: hypothetical protein U0989_17990 [Azonexus sp.]|nr:hypothetical protein [Azonexus sp.]